MTLELNFQPSKDCLGNPYLSRSPLKLPGLVEEALPGGLTWLLSCLNAEDPLVST